MHTQVHILSGWCAGSLVRLAPRERLMCMIAAAAADWDGLSSLLSEEAYCEYHHKLGHNFLFALLLAGTLTALSHNRLKSVILYLVLFHLHLVMDYFGSGFGWLIYYGWPISSHGIKNRLYGWEFYSWQNISTALALIGWTILIAIRRQRTPLELLMPNLDRQLVAWLRRMAGKREAGRADCATP